ncbi:hypothetical protein [Cellulomonas soli]|uniref:hypothetical protein n=1 Tax=Cellulomonas soli TaxID=931535 RepID=UPI003F86467F
MLLAITAAILAYTPSALDVDSLQSTRPYLSITSKRVFIAVGATAASCFLVFGFVQALVGFRILASVYAREVGGRVELASPWGRLGFRGQKIQLEPGPATVKFVREPRRGLAFFDMYRLFVSQDGRVLHVASYAPFSQRSREATMQWLSQHSIRVQLEDLGPVG